MLPVAKHDRFIKNKRLTSLYDRIYVKFQPLPFSRGSMNGAKRFYKTHRSFITILTTTFAIVLDVYDYCPKNVYLNEKKYFFKF